MADIDLGLNPVRSPCSNCTSRTSTCHIAGNCAKYDKYKFISGIYRRKINKQNEREYQFKRQQFELYKKFK